MFYCDGRVDGWDGYQKGPLIFFTRSDQFIKDFSCKFEGDLNFLVNFFWPDSFLKAFII